MRNKGVLVPQVIAEAQKKLFPVFLSVAILSTTSSMMLLIVPIYMTQVYDRVLGSESLQTLIYLTVITVFVLIILSIIDAIRSIILTRAGAAFEAKVAGQLLISSIMAGTHKEDAENAQGLRDLTQLRSFVAGPTLPVLFDTPLVPIFLGIVFLIHPILGALTSAGALVLICLTFIQHRSSGKRIRGETEYSIAAHGRAQSFLRESELVHSLGMYPDAIIAWGKDNAHAIADSLKAGNRAAFFQALSKLIRLTLQIALLGTGAYLTLSHEITAGMIFATSLIAGKALQPIDGIVGAWKAIIQAKYSYRRICVVLNATPAINVQFSLPPPKGKLVLEGVSYCARSTSLPLLAHVSFSLEGGRSLGIIGPAGAGKTTLARLIIGAIQPTGGVIRLDGADTRQWKRDELGPYLGYLPQFPGFFPGTIAQNIARMSVASDEAIVQAAQRAGAHQMILRLPDGYQTQIGSALHELSGGQKQRIGLARAFFGEPRLVVLDEPNANLDADGDLALHEAVLSAKALGSTVVIVAQRPSAIESVDFLMVLQNGRVSKYGPRQEVLAQLFPQAPTRPVINIRTARPRLVLRTGGPQTQKQAQTIEECLARIKRNLKAGSGS